MGIHPFANSVIHSLYMKNHEILIPPKVFISKVEPLLADDTRTYASALQGQLTREISLNITERLGKEVTTWEGQQAECLFEIIDAEFSPPPPPDSEDKPDPQLIEFKYMGYRNSCHFFPVPEAVKKDGKVDRQLYRIAMDEQFAEYGEDGFGLKPFDNQPVLKSANGYSFLVNKYLYKDLLKKTRKGTWMMAKINEVELLSITTPIQREQAPVSTDRVAEQQQQAEAMKVPRRKRFGVF